MNKCTLLLVCGLFLACNKPQAEITNENPVKIELASLAEKGPETISLKDWSKNIKFIPLETKEIQPVKNISTIIQKNNKLLIAQPQRASVFDLDGKYLYDIGQQGNKPENYISIQNLTVRNDTIFIKDKNNQIKLYNWQGKFMGLIPTPELPILDLYPVLDKDIFIGHIPNRTGENKNRLAIFRDTTVLNLIPTYSKFERVDGSIVITLISEMRTFDGNVSAFKELFNDTIFQIKPDYSLHPYAVINLGKNKATEEHRYALTPNMFTQKNFDMFDGKIALSAIGEKDDIIYMVPYNKIIKPYTFSFDKKSGKAYYQKITYPESQLELTDGSFFTPAFISTDGKYLIDLEFTKNDNKPVIVLVER
ncbi:6-bladed beta-propeller [Parabacteroides sp. AF14-59]|uniref:6-bladed beta-propeller n=1 Tax=Parabacteroides sp. AF14-59 TaxID=2292240 RepID=UPI000EFFFB40|nr:6-bladed beta-propeller [Parabacteroides sp. AF14-59]RHR91204.1 6-bladed beta-propeller [Parabacteroides sp. AF14-59]